MSSWLGWFQVEGAGVKLTAGVMLPAGVMLTANVKLIGPVSN